MSSSTLVFNQVATKTDRDVAEVRKKVLRDDDRQQRNENDNDAEFHCSGSLNILY